MSISLPTIRYYTPTDPYNYVVDNRPIYDLSNGLNVLKTAIESISSTNSGGISTAVSAGVWPLNVDIDLTNKLNSLWCLKMTCWVVETTTNLNNHTTFEQVIAGVNSAGTITIGSNTNANLVKVGFDNVSLSLDTSIPNKLRLIFSGYSGTTGYISSIYSCL